MCRESPVYYFAFPFFPHDIFSSQSFSLSDSEHSSHDCILHYQSRKVLGPGMPKEKLAARWHCPASLGAHVSGGLFRGGTYPWLSDRCFRYRAPSNMAFLNPGFSSSFTFFFFFYLFGLDLRCSFERHWRGWTFQRCSSTLFSSASGRVLSDWAAWSFLSAEVSILPLPSTAWWSFAATDRMGCLSVDGASYCDWVHITRELLVDVCNDKRALSTSIRNKRQKTKEKSALWSWMRTLRLYGEFTSVGICIHSPIVGRKAAGKQRVTIFAATVVIFSK